MPGKTDDQWINKRIEILLQHTDQLSKIEPGVYNPASSWSALKLISLGYYSKIYSEIIKRQPWIKNMYYVDLFSGSGLCKIDETGDNILGSPIVAPNCCKSENQFSKVIVVDQDKDRLRALEKRLDFLKYQKGGRLENVNYVGFPLDCNEAIHNVLNEMQEKDSHYLAFIDPYGMDPSRETMEVLLKRRGDVILTFQGFLIASRTLKNAVKNGKWEKFINFYGEDIVNQGLTGEESAKDLLELYIKMVIEPLKKGCLSTDILVKSRRHEAYNYNWLLITRKTDGGSPYLQAMESLKSRIERINGDGVVGALNTLKGRNSLQRWIPQGEGQ